MKKLISAILICCMIILMFPASAAEEATPQPTIEEILNEYHQKAFEAQYAGDTGGASTYSRSGSGSSKTLEQETVDTLTEAGYEAYNVTAENYTSLEADLNTDFAEMGLDPDSSYIVVVSGEPSQRAIGGTPGGSDIVQTPGDLEGGSVNFEYTYRDTTYTMRYLVLTSADDPRYYATDTAPLISASKDAQLINNSLNSLIYFCLDGAFPDSPIGLGTIADILGIEIANIHLQYSVSLSLRTEVFWTPVYTQVYDEVSNSWSCKSCVDYVQVINHFEGSYYDNDARSEVDINIDVPSSSYTEHYFDYEWRKHRAAMGVWYDTHYYEYIKDISVYNPLEEMNLTNIPERLFYFVRPIVVPPHTEGDAP